MFSSYIDNWLNYSKKEKEEILDTTKNRSMKAFGFRAELTKKRYVSYILNDCITTSNFDLFIELSKRALEMQGNKVDEYYINSSLVNYYERINNKTKAIEICIETLNEIENYIPELKTIQGKHNEILNELEINHEIGTLPDFIFCRDNLIILLIDLKRFEEAERFEKLFYEKNLYPDKKDSNRDKYNKLCRLNGLVDYYITINNPNSATKQCELMLSVDLESSANCYKKIGNYYLKKNNENDAYTNLNKAYTLNPRIEGVDNKLKRLSNKLGLIQVTDKTKVIAELIKKEGTNPKWFELRNIAKRYLSIEEFEDSIRIFSKLINEQGRENGLLEGLSNNYRSIGNIKYKEKEYFAALENYIKAYQIIENPEFPTKTIDKQKIRLMNAIEKTKNLIALKK